MLLVARRIRPGRVLVICGTVMIAIVMSAVVMFAPMMSTAMVASAVTSACVASAAMTSAAMRLGNACHWEKKCRYNGGEQQGSGHGSAFRFELFRSSTPLMD